MRTVRDPSGSDPTAETQVTGTEPIGLEEAVGPVIGRLKGLASELDRLAHELERLGSEHHGAIVVDCHVPTPNGFEATAAIRALRSAGWLTPIVATRPGAGRHWHPAHPEGSVGGDAPPDETTIDPAVVAELKLLGDACGTEFLSGLSAQFARETRPLMVRLRSAAEEGNTAEVARVARLVGRIAGDLGGRRLAASCQRVEVGAASDSLSDDESELQDVEIDYGELTASLTRLSSPAPPPPTS